MLTSAKLAKFYTQCKIYKIKHDLDYKVIKTIFNVKTLHNN